MPGTRVAWSPPGPEHLVEVGGGRRARRAPGGRPGRARPRSRRRPMLLLPTPPLPVKNSARVGCSRKPISSRSSNWPATMPTSVSASPLLQQPPVRTHARLRSGAGLAGGQRPSTSAARTGTPRAGVSFTLRAVSTAWNRFVGDAELPRPPEVELEASQLEATAAPITRLVDCSGVDRGRLPDTGDARELARDSRSLR